MESAKAQGPTRGGLAGAMFRRQATGGRGRSRRANCSPAALLLQSTGNLKKRLRVQLEGVPEMIADVRKSLHSGDHSALFSAVLAIRTKLVEGTSAPFDMPVRPNRTRTGWGGGGGGGGGAEHNHGHGHGHGHGHEDDEDNEDNPSNHNGFRHVRRLDREAFVSLGGPDLLLEVLRGPGSPADARAIPAAIVARDMPVWNTTLVILRELCFTDQDLSERLGSPELILYLLTLMAHQGVFDLAVGLVEEILAVKSSTYYLGEVPELHSLVENMTSQQLAHFSRVLALLVFEPEYRQLMESAHVLRSMELLQLRRDRVVRADSIIDKNQALILSAPNLLPRLMELLRVEVLFVLCTLLGARRKGEAHQALANLGLIDVLDSMFDRLSWGVPASTQGPHGAHCDCNPESALRVQYLRLVHNFLDRDSNNNPLKWLLLSQHETTLFSSGRFMPNPNGSGNVVWLRYGDPESEALVAFAWRGRATLSGDEEREGEEGGEMGAQWTDHRGLLSKIVDVFMKEPMDSLYRFWLASCVEAFLRGGSTQEQLFISGGGLIPHLVKEITSNGMWCAGSLQTAFDLLGELCKGNREVLEMLEASMTEKQLRRFLQVMVDNLVDSNVFMRSLVLSVEHSSFRQHFPGVPEDGEDEEEEEENDTDEEETAPRLEGQPGASGHGEAAFSAAGGDGRVRPSSQGVSTDAERQANGEAVAGGGAGDRAGDGEWLDYDGDDEPCYLGHTWYDVQPQEVQEEEEEEAKAGHERNAEGKVGTKPRAGLATTVAAEVAQAAAREAAKIRRAERRARSAGGADEAEGQRLTRLQCFLKHNTPQLLVRDLMCVVNLETINHENICCLNTAVLILIFADQRGQLAELLEAVRKLPAGKGASAEAEIDSEFDLDGDGDGDGDSGDSLAWPSSRARGTSNSGGGGSGGGGRCHHADPQADGGGGDGCEAKGGPQDGPTVLRNFRRLLWFWSEYYLRGGRDRLSLEFSTHVKFWAWKRVIRLLCADDGSPTSLVDAPLHLPRSPYDTVRPSSFLPAAAAGAAFPQDEEEEQGPL
eukprot:g5810.t1